jgi:indolepyruvate ferredoxin oxidoreductase alpha subunit
LVSGDIGCYTLGARATGFNRVNSVHCMGSGLGVSSGLGQLARLGFHQPVISVVGDSTFYHAALPALVNSRWNQADYLLVVLDNSATAMTGFQPHPGTGVTATGLPGSAVEVEEVCRGLGLSCQVVDPYDLAAAQEALYESLQQKGLRVLIFRRVCALVQGKRGGHPFRMSVDAAKCRGDECGCHRFCTRVFRCPGLYFDERTGRAHVDEVVCVGCGVCAQLCPAGAIQAVPKEVAA